MNSFYALSFKMNSKFKLILLFAVVVVLGCEFHSDDQKIAVQQRVFQNNKFQIILKSYDSICSTEKLDTNCYLVVGTKAYRDGFKLLRQGKMREANQLLSLSDKSFSKIDYAIGKGYANLVKADSYQLLEMSDSALWHYSLSKNYFAAQKDTLGMIITCNNLGIYLFELGALSFAYDNYLNARDFTVPSTPHWLVTEFNIANYLIETKDSASLAQGHEILLQLLDHTDILDSLNFSRIYNSLSSTEIKFFNGNKALEYIEKSIAYMPGADFSYIHIQYLNKAHALLLTGRKSEYEKIMNELESQYDEMRLNGKQHYMILRMMEGVPPEQNYVGRFLAISDTIMDRGYSNKQSIILQRFENEAKQQEIDVLAKLNHNQNERMRYNAIATSIISFLLAILGVLIVFMYRAGKRCCHSRELLKLEKEKTSNMNVELTEALHIKNRLMAIVAHDIRGPVGGLLQLVDVYSQMRDISADDLNKLLSNLKQASTSVYYLLDNLLLWANNQNNENHFVPSLQCVKPVLDAAIEDVRSWAVIKNINIELECDGEIDAFLDDNMVKTVVRNLISNSIKFSDYNSSILVKAYRENNALTVRVKDSGKGMSKEVLDMLFHSAERNNKESGHRNGFGLLVCRDFVDRHEGRMWAESVVRQGTSVFFTIPDKILVNNVQVEEPVMASNYK